MKQKKGTARNTEARIEARRRVATAKRNITRQIRFFDGLIQHRKGRIAKETGELEALKAKRVHFKEKKALEAYLQRVKKVEKSLRALSAELRQMEKGRAELKQQLTSL